MKGRRLPDAPEGSFPVPYDELRDGDIWKHLDRETGEPVVVDDEPSNLTKTAWTAMCPGGLLANLRAHTVREHEDGTVSVRAGDGSSNSILVKRRENEQWHGYVEHNEWTSV